MNNLIIVPNLKSEEIKVYIDSNTDIKYKILKLMEKTDKTLKQKRKTHSINYVTSNFFNRDNLKLYDLNYYKTKDILEILKYNNMYKIVYNNTIENIEQFNKYYQIKKEKIKIKVRNYKEFEIEVEYYLVKESLLSLLEQYSNNYIIINSNINLSKDHFNMMKFSNKKLIVDSDIKKKKLIRGLKYLANELNNSENSVDLDEYLENWVDRLLMKEVKNDN
jgi:hypothetical protein